MSIGSLLPTPKVNSIDSPARPKMEEKKVWCRNPKTGETGEYTMSNARDLQRHMGWEIIGDKPVKAVPSAQEQVSVQNAWLNGPTESVKAVPEIDPETGEPAKTA